MFDDALLFFFSYIEHITTNDGNEDGCWFIINKDDYSQQPATVATHSHMLAPFVVTTNAVIVKGEGRLMWKARENPKLSLCLFFHYRTGWVSLLDKDDGNVTSSSCYKSCAKINTLLSLESSSACRKKWIFPGLMTARCHAGIKS